MTRARARVRRHAAERACAENSCLEMITTERSQAIRVNESHTQSSVISSVAAPPSNGIALWSHRRLHMILFSEIFGEMTATEANQSLPRKMLLLLSESPGWLARPHRPQNATATENHLSVPSTGSLIAPSLHRQMRRL